MFGPNRGGGPFRSGETPILNAGAESLEGLKLHV